MANKSNSMLYTGVTGVLPERLWQHKQKVVPGFTKKYNADKPVYCEACGDAYSPISRERQIKAGTRKKKEALVERMNAEWRDLSDQS